MVGSEARAWKGAYRSDEWPEPKGTYRIYPHLTDAEAVESVRANVWVGVLQLPTVVTASNCRDLF